MSVNPLKQYFRRPAVYLKLPTGAKNYDLDTIKITETEELPVYPMTAIDEITIKTPDALYNGTAIAEIVKSCVPNIINPWKLTSIDLDAVLIAIRTASSGDSYDVESSCPKCKEVSKYGISLPAILAGINPSPYVDELQINELMFKFQPLTYFDLNETNIKQFEIQKVFNNLSKIENEEEQVKRSREAVKAITQLTMEVIAKTIKYIRTPNAIVEEKEFIYDYLKNCDKNSYIKIRDYNTDLREKVSIKPFDITCVNCENQYKQPFIINYSDFFD